MRKSFFISLLVALPFVLNAQSSGLPLLGIAPTAFELSRAEASGATPVGAASVYSNPALLINSPTTTLDLSYTNWIADANNVFGGINLVNEKRAIAFSFYTSGITGLEQRNNPGPSNGDFSIQYLAISAGYAHDFSVFELGVSGHYLNEEVYPYRARGYAFNAGISRSFTNDRFTVGASVQNIGEMENLDQQATDLPKKITFGASGSLFEYRHHKNPTLPVKISAAVDYIVPIIDNQNISRINFNAPEAFLNTALSFLVADVIQINAGYKTGNNVRPVSFGLGFITEKVIFNYANIPFNTGYGTVHSIGIQYQL